MKTGDTALLVEEEHGRVFCSEGCVSQYFESDVRKLESQYKKRLKKSDFTVEQREELLHLRFMTLQEPDEVWVQKRKNGDFWYTLISEFEVDQGKLWCICICLFLRGEPSFLFLAFPTKSKLMVQKYRQGESLRWGMPSNIDAGPAPTDGFDPHWTPHVPDKNDIPRSEYKKYERFASEVLAKPDELWIEKETEAELETYSFIRKFSNKQKFFWYVIRARELSSGSDELEVLDQVVTKHETVVGQFRLGDLDPRQAQSQGGMSLSVKVLH